MCACVLKVAVDSCVNFGPINPRACEQRLHNETCVSDLRPAQCMYVEQIKSRGGDDIVQEWQTVVILNVHVVCLCVCGCRAFSRCGTDLTLCCRLVSFHDTPFLQKTPQLELRHIYLVNVFTLPT